MRRFTLALLTVLVALPVYDAGAQIIRGGRFALREPRTWVSATFGWQEGWTVFDGQTSSRWDLGDTQQYGASIEHAVARGITLGVRATTSAPSVNYVRTTAPTVSQADTRVTQALGVVHVSTGRDLRSVFELGLGATIYSDFRERGTDLRLGPAKTDADFTFVFVYGLGYSFSRNFHVDVVQDLGTSLHQKTGLSAGEDTSARITSTRLVARYGIGG
ncbi:MAG TPA: hypothetical protein VFS59_11290 [Gemmatimonadaceae bacterium]|nr:hypothetical protein [Gemmatimonadaceae bacterium]